MKYKVGDLVRIASACEDGHFHEPAALVLSAYTDLPRIFLYNKEANKRWIEEEDVQVGDVYDILHEGRVEVGVSGEWLVSYLGD